MLSSSRKGEYITLMSENEEIKQESTKSRIQISLTNIIYRLGHFLQTWLFILVLCGVFYMTFIYVYEFCWLELYKTNRKKQFVAFITIYFYFLFMVFLIWLLIWWEGPGNVDKLTPYRLYPTNSNINDSLIEPPEVFQCDSFGYPIYCSMCGSIKPDRSHHSSEKGRCIPRMDHYCAWIGNVIGIDNYRMFIQFIFYFLFEFIFITITMVMYAKRAHDRRHGINPQFVVLYVFIFFWLLMLSGLAISQVLYIIRNETTIEDLNKRRNYLPYFNVLYNDNSRIIVPMLKTDQPYNLGFKKNFTQLMGTNFIYWILPIPLVIKINKFNPYDYKKYGNQINDDFIKELKERYENGGGTIMFMENRTVVPSTTRHTSSNISRNLNVSNLQLNIDSNSNSNQLQINLNDNDIGSSPEEMNFQSGSGSMPIAEDSELLRVIKKEITNSFGPDTPTTAVNTFTSNHSSIDRE